MEDPRWSKGLPDQTACGLKHGQEFPRNKKTTLQNVWKKVLKYEVLTDVKDFFKGSAGARVKLETDTALVLRCIEKDGSRRQPQAVATSVDASEEPTTSEHTEHAGENEATTYGPHRRNGTCGKLSLSIGTQASFCSRSYGDARSQSRNGQIFNINLDIANMGCKESVTEVSRSYPSGEGRWKNIAFFEFWWTLVTWRMPSSQNTSRNTQVASCALGWQRQRRRRIQSSTLRATCCSVSSGSGKVIGHDLNASWCDWRNTWRNFSVHSSQNDRSSQIVTLSFKMEQSLWLKVAKFVKLHQSNEELPTTTL